MNVQADVEALKEKIRKFRLELETIAKHGADLLVKLKAEMLSADSAALQQSETYGQALFSDESGQTGNNFALFTQSRKGVIV